MPFNAFWIFLSLGNLAWDFLGVNFGPGIFSGFDFFAPIWLSVSLELLQQVERHFTAATNHLVCIGEFVSATEFFGRNKSHKFSLIWFCATCCGGRCGDKTNSVAGMWQRCSQKFSSYTWLPSIQSFSTFLELRLRSGAWSSFLDLSSEWWNLLGVCTIMWWSTTEEKNHTEWELTSEGCWQIVFPTVDLKMSHQLGNDDGSSAPGSFLDFRPHAGENEERPPSGDPTGQVNQSFGKFIDSVNFTRQKFNDDFESIRGNRLLIWYSSGQSFFSACSDFIEREKQ